MEQQNTQKITGHVVCRLKKAKIQWNKGVIFTDSNSLVEVELTHTAGKSQNTAQKIKNKNL